MKTWPLWFSQGKGRLWDGNIGSNYSILTFQASSQFSILDPDRRRNVTFFIYSGNSPIKRDFKATYGLCVCSVSVKLKCPSHMGDIFNNADVDPDSNLLPLNLGSPPRSLDPPGCTNHSFWPDQYNLKYRAMYPQDIWPSQRASLALHLGR